MIIFNPISVVFYLILTAANITEFFLLVRLILSWKEISWLRPFDTAGTALVNSCVALTNRVTRKMNQKQLMPQGSIIACIIVLELTKILLCNI